MKINLKYISVFLVLLMVEIIIALFVNDKIIRPYIGDFLVVILMYTFIKGIVKKPIRFLPLYLLLFSIIVEFAQYYHILNLLHLQNNKVISIIIGNSYDIKDILCYLLATVVLMLWEEIEKHRILKCDMQNYNKNCL